MIERTSHPVGSYASLVFNQVDRSLSFSCASGVAAWVRFVWSFQFFNLLHQVLLRYQVVMLFLGMPNLLVQLSLLYLHTRDLFLV